jgi:hypothetical protein
MKNQNDQTKISVSGKKPRWRIWSRRREITSGMFPPQGAWGEWQPLEKVFDEDEYSDNEWWVSKHQSEDREYEIRPEPSDEEKDAD